MQQAVLDPKYKDKSIKTLLLKIASHRFKMERARRRRILDRRDRRLGEGPDRNGEVRATKQSSAPNDFGALLWGR
jgi:hypothetical protein